MAEALTTVRPSEAAQEAEPAWWEMLTLRLPAQLVLNDALLEALSGLNPAWNIERGGCGELVLSMASGGPSGVICSELCGEIRAWAKAVGGGLALESSAGFNVIDPEGGAPMRSPDAAWVSPEQLEATGGLPPSSGFWNLCPWFAAEVRSPSDSLAAQQQRMVDWLRFGVRLGWLIDPQNRSVWLYRPDRDPERLERPALLSGEAVLPGFRFDCGPIWQMLDRIEAAAQAE